MHPTNAQAKQKRKKKRTDGEVVVHVRGARLVGVSLPGPLPPIPIAHVLVGCRRLPPIIHLAPLNVPEHEAVRVCGGAAAVVAAAKTMAMIETRETEKEREAYAYVTKQDQETRQPVDTWWVGLVITDDTTAVRSEREDTGNADVRQSQLLRRQPYTRPMRHRGR